MRKEELIKQLQERAPLLANAVSHMVTYVTRALSLHLSKQGTDRGGEQLPAKCPCRWRRKYIRTEL